jgi:hypothetical protein
MRASGLHKRLLEGTTMQFNSTTKCEYCGKYRSAADHSKCSKKRQKAKKDVYKLSVTDIGTRPNAVQNEASFL